MGTAAPPLERKLRRLFLGLAVIAILNLFIGPP